MQGLLETAGLFASSSKKQKRNDPFGTFMGNNFENKKASEARSSEIHAVNTQLHAAARGAIEGNTNENREMHAAMHQRQAVLEQHITALGESMDKTPSQLSEYVHGIFRYISFLHESIKAGFVNNNKYYDDILKLMHQLIGLMDSQIAREIHNFQDILAANKSNLAITKEDFDLNKHNTRKLDEMNQILESILSKLNVPDKIRNDRTSVDHLLGKLSINRRLPTT